MLHPLLNKPILLALYISLCILSNCTHSTQAPQNSPLATIRLDIKPTDMLKIQHKRERALQQGMLITKSDDYVPVKLTYNDRPLSGEIRLKGDWLDHLRGNKWSWRVKLADSCQVKGIQRFSLQHPRVRSYLDEWVFHKLLEQEGILTTKYDFVHLILNGRYKGIFALEEHFDKALLHNNNRPEGAILKFSEDGFWQAQAIHQRTGVSLTHVMPVFESAEIEAFQKGKTLRDTFSKECFQAAKGKLQSMRLADKKASETVDIDRMARWYALSDLVESYHGMRWHNMRFYYHPIKGVLEPIVYDAFGGGGAYRWFSKPLVGSYNENADTIWLAEEHIVYALLNHDDFRDKYHLYLQKYAQNGFVKEFMAIIKPELQQLENLLQEEYSNYNYNWSHLNKGAQRLSKELKNYVVHPPRFERVVSPFLFDTCRSELPIPEVALRIHPISKTTVLLENYYCQPITLKAIGRKKSDQRIVPDLELPPFTSKTWPLIGQNYSIKADERYFYYTVPSNDSWFRQKISPWPMATTKNTLDLSVLQIDSSFMSVHNQSIVIKKGHYSLDQLVIIPEQYNLVIEAGTKIDLINESAIIINGNLWMEGKEQQKIRLYSSDQSSKGVHILNGALQVKMAYVEVDNLGDWWGPERWFKGGFSILESKTTMNNCHFSNMRGEDALNIVGSKEVSLQNIHFENCEGDGLDMDYCIASLKNVSFEYIGGDGLDFSGSQIKVADLELKYIVDKGISIGEESQVNIQETTIAHASLGIGIKDGSSAILNHLSIENCDYGVAVFNKKPIFMPATAEIIDFYHKNCGNIYVLEANHGLSIEGQEKAVTHEKYRLIEVFYENMNRK